MRNPRRIQSFSEIPSVINLGNNSYYYNYDVKKSTAYKPEMKENAALVPAWTAIQVECSGNVPVYKDIVRAVLRKYLTLDEEFDLINSYNEAVASGETEGKDIDAYKEYLSLRKNIKDYVKKDLNLSD